MHEHRELSVSVLVAVRDAVGETLAVAMLAVIVVAAVAAPVWLRSAHEQLRSRPVCRHA